MDVRARLPARVIELSVDGDRTLAGEDRELGGIVARDDPYSGLSRRGFVCRGRRLGIFRGD